MTPVVHLSCSSGVASVRMEDRPGSNTFTAPLVEGLLSTFATIRTRDDVNVVVLHGYDSIFCAGGTKDELLGIVEGRIRFDEVPLYRLLLDCEVPVVAAMQGHALGGGFVFGLYADIVVLAEESLYSTNFMKYGFTPGMGATCVVPAKLGNVLAAEMLLSARSYHGGELRDRGAPFAVVKRAEVVKTALRVAADLADKPQLSLKLLKKQLTADLVGALPAAVKREIEMHQLTFAQPGIRDRITSLFGS